MHHPYTFDKQLLAEISNGHSTFKNHSIPGGYDETFIARLNSLRRLHDIGYIHPYFDMGHQTLGKRKITKVYDIFITDSGKQYLKGNK